MNEPRWKIEACDSCRHAVVWARLETGRPVAINAAPTQDGDVFLAQVQGFTRASVSKGSVLDGLRRTGHPLRTRHECRKGRS